MTPKLYLNKHAGQLVVSGAAGPCYRAHGNLVICVLGAVFKPTLII